MIQKPGEKAKELYRVDTEAEAYNYYHDLLALTSDTFVWIERTQL